MVVVVLVVYIVRWVEWRLIMFFSINGRFKIFMWGFKWVCKWIRKGFICRIVSCIVGIWFINKEVNSLNYVLINVVLYYNYFDYNVFFNLILKVIEIWIIGE